MARSAQSPRRKSHALTRRTAGHGDDKSDSNSSLGAENSSGGLETEDADIRSRSMGSSGPGSSSGSKDYNETDSKCVPPSNYVQSLTSFWSLESRRRQRRLELNRKAAQESRRRKKLRVEELQRAVFMLTQENSELREQNEMLRARNDRMCQAFAPGQPGVVMDTPGYRGDTFGNDSFARHHLNGHHGADYFLEHGPSPVDQQHFDRPHNLDVPHPYSLQNFPKQALSTAPPSASSTSSSLSQQSGRQQMQDPPTDDSSSTDTGSRKYLKRPRDARVRQGPPAHYREPKHMYNEPHGFPPRQHDGAFDAGHNGSMHGYMDIMNSQHHGCMPEPVHPKYANFMAHDPTSSRLHTVPRTGPEIRSS